MDGCLLVFRFDGVFFFVVDIVVIIVIIAVAIIVFVVIFIIVFVVWERYLRAIDCSFDVSFLWGSPLVFRVVVKVLF